MGEAKAVPAEENARRRRKEVERSIPKRGGYLESMVRSPKETQGKRLLYVEWADATTQDGWDADHNLETHIIRSVGFLVKETKRDLVIAADWSEPESNRRLAIPKAWIQNKKELFL